MRRYDTHLLAIVLLFGAVGAECQPSTPRAKSLTIYIADTEGGKAALFISPTGETVLVDTGNSGARDGDRILAMLASAGVTRIDYLISTHYHTDHVGGLTSLASRIPIAQAPALRTPQTVPTSSGVLTAPHRTTTASPWEAS